MLFQTDRLTGLSDILVITVIALHCIVIARNRIDRVERTTNQQDLFLRGAN